MNRDVGAHIPSALAGPQLPDCEDAAEDEPAQGNDRQWHMDVEDLLDKALICVERGIEEDERQRRGERNDGRQRQRRQTPGIRRRLDI